MTNNNINNNNNINHQNEDDGKITIVIHWLLLSWLERQSDSINLDMLLSMQRSASANLKGTNARERGENRTKIGVARHRRLHANRFLNYHFLNFKAQRDCLLTSQLLLSLHWIVHFWGIKCHHRLSRPEMTIEEFYFDEDPMRHYPRSTVSSPKRR